MLLGLREFLRGFLSRESDLFLLRENLLEFLSFLSAWLTLSLLRGILLAFEESSMAGIDMAVGL